MTAHPLEYGIAGDIVAAITADSEADPWAVLMSFLTGFGASVGGGPHTTADGAQHPPRLFVVLVGDSAKARKGTSWANAKRVLERMDPPFFENRVLGGFGSGEALIDSVAEDTDCRTLVVESEFGKLLRVSNREGSTLSPIIRAAWDGDRLEVRSRGKTAVAVGRSLAVLGHITKPELIGLLSTTDLFSGFANRFLFCRVHRSGLKPWAAGISDPEAEALALSLSSLLSQAHKRGRIEFTDTGRIAWGELYYRLAEDDPPGLLGQVVARGDAQCLRLALCWALLDGVGAIDTIHVDLAAQVWEKCRDSAETLFGDRSISSDSNRILDFLERVGEAKRSDISRELGGHTSAARLDDIREELVAMERIQVLTQRGDGGRGRSAEVWATTKEAKEAKEGEIR